MRRQRWHHILGAVTIAAAGCSDVVPPESQPELSVVTRGAGISSAEAKGWASARVADEVPDFGGAFVDADGVMTIYVTDPRATGAAQRAIRQILARRGEETRQIRVLQSKHTLGQLRAWHAKVRPVSQMPGVVGTYVDERRNLVRIAIESAEARNQVVTVLPTLGIPTDLVDFEISTRVRDGATLLDRIRPLHAGMVITRPYAGGSESCSMGIYVTYNNEQHAVTASHCTQDPAKGGFQDADFYQPGSPFNSTNYIGHEVHDPVYSASAPGCPATYRCRNSDAALIRIMPHLYSYPGSIARPTQRVLLPGKQGSLTIDAANPYITLKGTADVFAGDIVEKVGKRTGWTAGPVTFSCQPTEQTISGIKYLTVCSSKADMGNGPGDSGGPVFYRNAAGDYYLAGIYYAGNHTSSTLGSSATFSNWSGIELDLGASGYDLDVVNMPIGTSVSWSHSEIYPGNTYTWYAGAYGGTGQYSFAWDYNDGTGWHSLGTGTSVSRFITAQDPDFTLRVITTSPGWIGGNDTLAFVVDNRGYSPPPPPLSGYIDGPSVVGGDQSCTWFAYANGGSGSYSYQWFWDNDLVGTTAMYQRSFPSWQSSNWQDVGHLTLIITDGDGTIFEPDGIGVFRDDQASECW